jgi:serine/threonine-protein kinase
VTSGDSGGSKDDERTKRGHDSPEPEQHQYSQTLPDSTMPAKAGSLDRLLTRYKIGEVLGRGGMGEVLSARDEHLGRSVAIKRMRVASPPQDLLARFLREARVQARLEHPAVVPVYEVHDDEGAQPYFVMKQLAGVTLSDVIPKLAAGDPQTSQAFTRQRLLRAFAEVCLAIEFAHTRGIVHRDLKPANIQLGEFGEVYVLDWGVARIVGEQPSRGSFADIDPTNANETAAGVLLGTPGYIAPEQIRGDADLDARIDVFALGCVLFETLALQPLHPRGESAIASTLAGVDARPSVRAPDRDIPPELDAICVRATQLDRERRYPTARALGDAVQEFLDGNRDIALRKQLALTELDAARAAAQSTDADAGRTTAMRAAARALALDPTNPEPAEIVGRLMLEPPRETPAEVEHELAQLDFENLLKSRRQAMFAAGATLFLFAVLYATGFGDLWSFALGSGLCALIVIIQVGLASHRQLVTTYTVLALFCAMFALLGWMLSPIIVGPGPGVILVVLMAAHKHVIRPWHLSLAAGLAIISSWALEPSTIVSGNTITLYTAATNLHPTVTLVGLGVYILGTILMAGFLSRLQDDDRKEQRRRLHVQSWQLRQLVPKGAPRPPPS